MRDPYGERTRLRTNDNGALKAHHVAPGHYSLLARQGDAVGAKDFELKDDIDLGTLKLTEAIRVTGRIFSAQGAPMKGATVEAVFAEEKASRMDFSQFFRRIAESNRVAAHARSKVDGTYELLVPGKGQYSFRAFADRFGQETESARPIMESLEGLDFHLFAAIDVSGEVVNADGDPVAGAHLNLSSMRSVFAGGVPKVETFSRDDGSFTLPVGLSETSNALLTVRAHGYATHVKSNLKAPSQNVRIVLESGVTLRLRTVEAGEVAHPIEGVKLSVIYGGGFGIGESDEMGDVFVENLPTKSSGMGRQKSAILTATYYVPVMRELGGIKIEDGVIDAGDIAMDKGGVVRGVVRDKLTRKPVEGALVRSMGGLSQMLAILGGNVSITDKQGKYELYGVPLKASTVMAMHPEYLAEMDMMALAGMGRNNAGAPSIFPGGQTEITKDIEISPGARIKGIVVDTNGDPVSGVRVTAKPTGSMRSFMVMFTGGLPKTISAADGTFTLGPVKQGETISVVASHREYGAPEPVKTTGGVEGPIRITLAPPLIITGKVVGEDGAPIQGVRVTAQRKAKKDPMREMNEMFDTGGPRPGVTDQKGEFTIRNAPPGEIILVYSHPGYLERNERVSAPAGKPSFSAPKVTLERGPGIDGIIVDESGKPLGGVRVNVWMQGQSGIETVPSPAAPPQGRRYANMTTDSTGRFELYGLIEGKYQFNITYAGLFAEPRDIVTGTSDLRIVMQEAAELRGVVLGQGRPVADATVRAELPDTTRNVGWARTGPDGSFSLDALPPGRSFKLTVQHQQYKKLVVESASASSSVQEFHLKRGRVVSGTVVDTLGAPVEGAVVQILAGQARSAVTDKRGQFEISGLEENDKPITVRLQESAKGFIQESVTVGDGPVRLVAVVGESISGVVEGAAGASIAYASIQALDDKGGIAGSTWIQGDGGTFTLKGLRPGTYKIKVQRWNREPRESTSREIEGIRTGSKDVVIRFE
ncbi:MAG: carboxypeptidase-like regulatory domain-containing protein [Planctomycetota bacterium]|nr:carboxypeptidase-like regulatory domain-containing protein [Planctomycetota bacterium]